MTAPTVEEGVRAWLAVLPPSAGPTTPLLVDDLAPHLSSDAVETVRIMEHSGLTRIEILQRCPECSGLDGVHVDTHEDVNPEETLAYRVLPERLLEWTLARLKQLDIEITQAGDAVVLHRAVEVDAQIDAPEPPAGPGRREVRLRLGLGGNEAPLVLAPGRAYLRLGLGSAVDLGADRRVISVDLMHLLGSSQARTEFRERLRRHLHGLMSLTLIHPGIELDKVDQSQVLTALSDYLSVGGRYRESSDRHLWQALAEDWGVPAESVRMRYQRSDGVLLACGCDADTKPHIHAFSADGRSIDALAFEPDLRKFRDHQHARTRDMLELAAVRRHLANIGGLARAALAFAGTTGISWVAGDTLLPALSGWPVNALAVGAGAIAAVVVLNDPLRRLGILLWRLRSGSWKVPREAKDAL